MTTSEGPRSFLCFQKRLMPIYKTGPLTPPPQHHG